MGAVPHARGGDYYFFSKIEYNITPVATARFNEVTLPCMGIFNIQSQIEAWEEVNPSRSLPISKIKGNTFGSI
jgi:hypothetical protein